MKKADLKRGVCLPTENGSLGTRAARSFSRKVLQIMALKDEMCMHARAYVCTHTHTGRHIGVHIHAHACTHTHTALLL